MNSNLKKMKKVLSLVLVLLVTTNSFAATVGDNDGSAFISKAEYDSLKSNFQSQIDNYNTNIDNKIDEAISAYLAGIKVSSKQPWNSEYGINEFLFYAKDYITSIPKIKLDAYFGYKNSSNNNNKYGAWNGGIEWKSTSAKSSVISFCLGAPIGTNEFKLKKYDKGVDLKGAFTFVKSAEGGSTQNTLIAQNGGDSWVIIKCNLDSSKNQTYMRGTNVNMKDATYGDNYTPSLLVNGKTSASYLNTQTISGLKYYNFSRTNSSNQVITDMLNEMYGVKWAAAWSAEETGDVNIIPMSQKNTNKFFCLNPDDSDMTWYFDNLEPDVGKITLDLKCHMALNTLNNFKGTNTWNIYQRLIPGNNVQSYIQYDVFRQYTNPSKSGVQNTTYNWSKNFLIAPPSGYFAANKVRQYIDEEGKWFLSSGIVLSKECTSNKLVLLVTYTSPDTNDTVKVAASKIPFTNGTTTTKGYKINGVEGEVTLKKGESTKLSIAVEKGEQSFLMVKSQNGKDINFEIVKDESYWEIN